MTEERNLFFQHGESGWSATGGSLVHDAATKANEATVSSLI